MKKTFKQIINEIEEDEPLFDVKNKDEMEVNTPEEFETQGNTEEKGVEDPSFTFEINGSFNFSQLEKFMSENEQGLENESYHLVINTKGKVTDEDYENFIKYIEDKMNFLNFVK